MMTSEMYAVSYQEGLGRTIRFLISRGVCRDSAPDFAQAAWLRGWERLNQLRDESLLVTWINTIALNCYRRSLRSEHLQYHVLDSINSNTSLNLAAIDISRILQSCRPPDRMLLEAQMAGATAAEIGKQQGVSQTAIRIRMLRARRAARGVIEAGSNATSASRNSTAVANRRAA
jgi:RNA polymerase sigma factor (sigma-70 family)